MRLSSILSRTPKQQAVKLCTVMAWAALRYETPPARQTLYRWCSDGRLPGAVKNGHWYVPVDAEYCAPKTEKWNEIAYGN